MLLEPNKINIWFLVVVESVDPHPTMVSPLPGVGRERVLCLPSLSPITASYNSDDIKLFVSLEL